MSCADMNTAITSALLTALVLEFRTEFPKVKTRKDAWVYRTGWREYEFQGRTGTLLEGFYWHGKAWDAYEARYRGLLAWREKQKCVVSKN